MLGLDEAHEIAKSVFADAQLHFADIKTEEDAKLRIITRILTEVLGWKHSDISSERINENGYSDYLINDDTHGVLILEAKKVGLINVNTQATTKQNYKISGPALKDALLGIQQAASYCAPNGIQLAVLTDGYTWIVFRPFIPDERYQDKQAITFPGFEAVLSDFATFYELISKFSCKKNTYKLIFDNIHENRLTQTQGLTAAFSGSDIRIEQKSSLAFDLEKVFSRFFSSLAGDDDPDLLIDCFVETRESRVADFSLEKITQNVLGNIAISEKSVDEGLDTLIQSAILEEAGQTVFIVGPSGAASGNSIVKSISHYGS